MAPMRNGATSLCEVRGFESKLQKLLTTATEENSTQSLKIHASTSRDMREHYCLQMPLRTYPERERDQSSKSERAVTNATARKNIWGEKCKCRKNKTTKTS